MIGDREVILFQDPRMLDHRPDPDAAFLPGRLDRRVREILSGLGAKWSYPEHRAGSPPCSICSSVSRCRASV